MKWLVCLGLLLSSALAFSAPSPINSTVSVELYLSSSCGHCKKADQYFQQLEKKWSWLKVERYWINQNKADLERFAEQLKNQHSDNFAVPGIFFCHSHWFGFSEVSYSAEPLQEALQYCHQQLSKPKGLSPGAMMVLRQRAAAAQFEKIALPPSKLEFTLSTAFLDTLSFCSLFFGLSFISLLCLKFAKPSQQTLLAGCFMLGVITIHLLSQIFTDSFYFLMVQQRWIFALVGSISLLLLWKRSQFIKGLYLLGLLLGFIMQFIQQSCSLNMSLVYAQWLGKQQIARYEALLYQMLYEAIYIIPFILLLLICLFIFRRSASGKEKGLKMTALLLLYLIAFALIIYPRVLMSSYCSYFALGFSLLIAYSYRRYFGQRNL